MFKPALSNPRTSDPVSVRYLRLRLHLQCRTNQDIECFSQILLISILIATDYSDGIDALNDAASQEDLPRGVDGFVDPLRNGISALELPIFVFKDDTRGYFPLFCAKMRDPILKRDLGFLFRCWLHGEHGQSKSRRREDLEKIGLREDHVVEHHPQTNMVPDVRFQARDTVASEDEPDLQGAETAPERDLPVAVIGHETGVREIVAKIGRRDGEG